MVALNLSGNFLGSLEEVEKIRKTMPKLRSLDLSRNPLIKKLNPEVDDGSEFEEPLGGGEKFRAEVLILLPRLIVRC